MHTCTGRLLLGLMALLWLAGCVGGGRSPQTEFYSLSSLAEQGEVQEVTTQALAGAVGVGPISFPDYADRPQVVARTSDNRVRVEEFHRWAGSVKQDFSRVVVENLSMLLGSDRVFAFPWRGSVPVTRRVTVDVVRFDGVPGGQTTLTAHWAVIDEQEGKVLHTERTRLRETTQAHGYSGVAATLSHLTAELSRRIAVRLAPEPEK